LLLELGGYSLYAYNDFAEPIIGGEHLGTDLGTACMSLADPEVGDNFHSGKCGADLRR
jgi:hypothetical protein